MELLGDPFTFLTTDDQISIQIIALDLQSIRMNGLCRYQDLSRQRYKQSRSNITLNIDVQTTSGLLVR